jgi:tetratricopeptide (TPR) repeat protein
LALFASAMLSKTASVTLPAVLALLLVWRNGRLVRADLPLLAPFFLVALAVVPVTAFMEDQLIDPRAFEDLDRAVELNPRYPHSYLIRGNLRLELKQLRGAIDDSDVVPAAKPDEFRVRLSRGNAKQGLGDDKGACEDWLRTCVMSADSHDIDCRLLECLRDGGAR